MPYLASFCYFAKYINLYQCTKHYDINMLKCNFVENSINIDIAGKLIIKTCYMTIDYNCVSVTVRC